MAEKKAVSLEEAFSNFEDATVDGKNPKLEGTADMVCDEVTWKGDGHYGASMIIEATIETMIDGSGAPGQKRTISILGFDKSQFRKDKAMGNALGFVCAVLGLDANDPATVEKLKGKRMTAIKNMIERGAARGKKFRCAAYKEKNRENEFFHTNYTFSVTGGAA